MKKIYLIAAWMLTACTDPTSAKKALEGAGYTSIKLGGPNTFACSDDDTMSTEFWAKGPTGKNVEGVVCSGYLKGSTIRIK